MQTSNILLILLLFIAALVHTLGNNIPSYVHLCKRNDPNLSNCIRNTYEGIRSHLIDGIPELNLAAGDPYQFPNLTVHFGGSIALNGVAWNGIATGLLNVDIKDVNIDFDQVICSITLVFPFVRLRGEYKLDGEILLFQLNSTGKFDINATEIVSKSKLIGKYHTKGGKQYIEFEKVIEDLEHIKLAVYFTNLMGNNEELTDNLNRAINGNFDVLYQDVLPVASASISSIVRDNFNRVFRSFSVDELFPLS